MKLSPLFAGLMLVGSVGALPAHADDKDLSSTRMQQLDQRATTLNLQIKHARAIEIAKAQGLVTLREIEVDISARDGTVMKLDRD